MTKVIWRRQSIFASSISLNHLQSVLLLLPVGASTKGSGCPEGRRLPVIVGVREAVEVAAVPLQLRHAAVVLPSPPFPASRREEDMMHIGHKVLEFYVLYGV